MKEKNILRYPPFKEDGRSGREVEEIAKEDGGSSREEEGVKEEGGPG